MHSDEYLKHHDLGVFNVYGVPITATSLDETERWIAKWAQDDTGRFIGVRELPSIYALSQSEELRAISYHAAMNVPDGMPLVWIGKKLGFDISRTSGPDLLPYVASKGPSNGLKHYFYGGKPGVPEKLIAALKKIEPGVSVVGHESPPFRALSDQEAQDVRDRIKASGADIVWVGISSPKQDIWMKQNVGHLPCTLIGVGAAFDNVSGELPRAPKWMQRLSLESVFRFILEPKRLWRRYFVYAPRVLWSVLFQNGAKVIRKN